VRAGIDPDSVQRKDIERLLPEIHRALTVYLGNRAADDRATWIRKTLGG